MSERKIVEDVGIDYGTEQIKVGVHGNGKFDLVVIPNVAPVKFCGEPAFNVEDSIKFANDGIEKLKVEGWDFSSVMGVSFSVRQHELVLLDKNMEPIGPAISWQSGIATEEVKQLIEQKLHEVMGSLPEERFVPVKLMWLLKQDSSLKDNIHRVMTLDAYLAYILTGKEHLSRSEAQSNWLLDINGDLAEDVLKLMGLEPEWFPEVIDAGELVGAVNLDYSSPELRKLTTCLNGAGVYAGRGDNDSLAHGLCQVDFITINMSAGTSGTVVRLAEIIWKLLGKVGHFDYDRKILLLAILKKCGSWYSEFFRAHCNGHSHRYIDSLTANPRNKFKILYLRDGESYPEGFNKLTLTNKFRSIEASIALELLLLLKTILLEVDESSAPAIERVGIIGGISASKFFTSILYGGLNLILPNAVLVKGSAPGKFSEHSAALGALITAMAEGEGWDKLVELMKKYCTTEELEFASEYSDLANDFMSEKLSA